LTSLYPWPRYGDFSIFQDGGRRNLGFLKFLFLPVGTVKKVELSYCVKFRRHRTYRGRDMVIFDFQDDGRRHLKFFEISNF